MPARSPVLERAAGPYTTRDRPVSVAVPAPLAVNAALDVSSLTGDARLAAWGGAPSDRRRRSIERTAMRSPLRSASFVLGLALGCAAAAGCHSRGANDAPPSSAAPSGASTGGEAMDGTGDEAAAAAREEWGG